MCFFLKIPLMNIYVESFKELETIAIKAKLSNNYGLFLLIYVRYAKEILHKLVT